MCLHLAIWLYRPNGSYVTDGDNEKEIPAGDELWNPYRPNMAPADQALNGALNPATTLTRAHN